MANYSIEDEYHKIDPELLELIGNFFSSPITQGEEDGKIIYQYTTWEGLKGIIENQCIWFTDYKFLNDISEINYSVEYFCENIFSHCEDEKNMFYRVQQSVLNHKPFYIASMCARENYLPAWRLYANDGAGFAIGFNRKKVREGWYYLKENEPAFEGILQEVEYIDRSNISEKEKQWFKRLKEYYKIIKNDNDKILEFRLAIRSLFPLVKHVCYQEEKEIRMSFSNLCYRGSDVKQKIYFRNSGAYPFCNSVPYICKPIEIDWIEEIWTGPRVNDIHATREIKKLLDKKTVQIEHSISMKHSTLPYKNTDRLLKA